MSEEKVVVVIEDNGTERRYSAPHFATADNGELVIGTLGDQPGSDQLAALYPPGHWKRVFTEGVEVDGVRPKALRLQSALRKIGMAEVAGDDAEMLQRFARECLEGTGWDGEDL